MYESLFAKRETERERGKQLIVENADFSNFEYCTGGNDATIKLDHSQTVTLTNFLECAGCTRSSLVLVVTSSGGYSADSTISF